MALPRLTCVLLFVFSHRSEDPPIDTGGYSSEGCYVDAKNSRIMTDKSTGDTMSAEVRKSILTLIEGCVPCEISG